MNDKPLKVMIDRGRDAAISKTVFEVPAFDNQTVLDVVSWVQQNADPTLSYRFACRVGMCGSCAMMVNGVPRWTCRTHISKVSDGNTLTIGPLRNLPVIKDLVVDMDPFFDKWIPTFSWTERRIGRAYTSGRLAAGGFCRRCLSERYLAGGYPCGPRRRH